MTAVATFNSPLEAGLRVVALLEAAYPKSLDLTRLIALDYLLVHTGDIDGPESLHPPSPFQSGEFLVRRKLIERALLLMMIRDLVSREPTPRGIAYSAGNAASTFLGALTSRYVAEMRDRADWLNDRFGHLSDPEFHDAMREHFARWIDEFQTVERSLGADL